MDSLGPAFVEFTTKFTMKSSKGKDSDNTLSGDTILGADMESEVRASGSLREGSNTQVEFRLHYSVDEIKRLAQEIQDETVNDGLMALFTGWVCDDFENYELAKQYIRELGIDDVSDQLNRLTKESNLLTHNIDIRYVAHQER